jgi:Putative beta-barrel porin 2
MNMGRFHGRIVPALGLSLLASASAMAQTAGNVGYHVSAGVAQSDNIRRTPDNEESETVGTAGLDFSVAEQTRKLKANAAADLQYLDYFGHTYSSEIVGNFLGGARVEFVPERFNWMAQDNFGQSRIDPLSQETPDNRENVNYFTTGPDLGIPVGSETNLRLGGRYSAVTYQDSPLDNHRVTGMAGLVHALSSFSNVSFDVQRESVRYSDAPNPDYDHDQAFMRYEAHGGRTQLSVDLGYGRFQKIENGPSGVVARFEVSRQISASSIVAASVGRDFSDAGDSFRFSQSLSGPAASGSNDTLPTAAPFTSDYVTVSWNFLRNRTGLDLRVAQFKESYDQAPQLNRKHLVADAGVSRSLSSTLRAELSAHYDHESYQHLAGDYGETSLMARLVQRLGRNLSLMGMYQRAHRSSDIAATEYSENRFWLTLSYGRDAGQTGVEAPRLPSSANF